MSDWWTAPLICCQVLQGRLRDARQQLEQSHQPPQQQIYKTPAAVLSPTGHYPNIGRPYLRTSADQPTSVTMESIRYSQMGREHQPYHQPPQQQFHEAPAAVLSPTDSSHYNYYILKCKEAWSPGSSSTRPLAQYQSASTPSPPCS